VPLNVANSEAALGAVPLRIRTWLLRAERELGREPRR